MAGPLTPPRHRVASQGGALLWAGSDLDSKGVLEYTWDLLYVIMFIQMATCFLSDVFFLVAFVPPAIGFYFAWTMYIYPWISKPDQPREVRSRHQAYTPHHPCPLLLWWCVPSIRHTTPALFSSSGAFRAGTLCRCGACHTVRCERDGGCSVGVIISSSSLPPHHCHATVQQPAHAARVIPPASSPPAGHAGNGRQEAKDEEGAVTSHGGERLGTRNGFQNGPSRACLHGRFAKLCVCAVRSPAWLAGVKGSPRPPRTAVLVTAETLTLYNKQH